MSSSTEMNLTPSGSPIYVTLMQEFQRCPPSFFRMEQGGQVLRHDPTQVNVCVRSTCLKIFVDSMGGVLKVSTESQMQALMARLLEKPIFLAVGIVRNKKEFCSNVRYITKGQLAVTVNPQHPQMRHILQSQLVQGLDAMRQGKKFAVEFDFNKIFESWMKSLYPNDEFVCDAASGYETSGGKFTVTNDEEFMDCFACSYPEVLVWVVCLPCCLLTCPCYRIYRALTVSDFGGDVYDMVPTYWSANAQLRNMEETVARVLMLMAQQQEPPTYSDATGQQLSYGQPAVQAQPGYGQRAVQAQPGYGQRAVQAQPGYGQPAVQAQPGYSIPVVQSQPGYGHHAQQVYY